MKLQLNSTVYSNYSPLYQERINGVNNIHAYFFYKKLVLFLVILVLNISYLIS